MTKIEEDDKRNVINYSEVYCLMHLLAAEKAPCLPKKIIKRMKRVMEFIEGHHLKNGVFYG